MFLLKKIFIKCACWVCAVIFFPINSWIKLQLILALLIAGQLVRNVMDQKLSWAQLDVNSLTAGPDGIWIEVLKMIVSWFLSWNCLCLEEQCQWNLFNSTCSQLKGKEMFYPNVGNHAITTYLSDIILFQSKHIKIFNKKFKVNGNLFG